MRDDISVSLAQRNYARRKLPPTNLTVVRQVAPGGGVQSICSVSMPFVAPRDVGGCL